MIIPHTLYYTPNGNQEQTVFCWHWKNKQGGSPCLMLMWNCRCWVSDGEAQTRRGCGGMEGGLHGRLGGCRQRTLCTMYISCMRSQCRAHIHLYIFLGHTYIYNLRTRLHIYELSMQSTSACNICPLRRFPNLDAPLWLGDNILVQEGERLHKSIIISFWQHILGWAHKYMISWFKYEVYEHIT